MHERIGADAKGIIPWTVVAQISTAKAMAMPFMSTPAAAALPWLRCALQRTVGRLNQEHFIDQQSWAAAGISLLVSCHFLAS